MTTPLLDRRLWVLRTCALCPTRTMGRQQASCLVTACSRRRTRYPPPSPRCGAPEPSLDPDPSPHADPGPCSVKSLLTNDGTLRHRSLRVAQSRLAEQFL